MARTAMTQKKVHAYLNTLAKSRKAASEARTVAQTMEDGAVKNLLIGAHDRFNADVEHISAKLIRAVFAATAQTADVDKFVLANIHVFPEK